jgi:sugar-specific transcriptional regulator TrmB
MPVPGSLKKRPFDHGEIARLLESQFSLPENEALAYLKLVETRNMSLEDIASSIGIGQTEASVLARNMVSRGLMIEAPGPGSTFIPLHPRMMLTNLFKIYEKDVVGALRERRATVDRVVNLLTPVYEERSGKKE